MATRSDPDLPPRLQQALTRLLEQLADNDHDLPRLLGQQPLPRWSRAPLFFLLGYIARADGRVTEADIACAESIIRALDLNRRQRRHAIRCFHKGKRVQRLPPHRGLSLHLSQWLWPGPALQVAACLCHAALAAGRPSRARRYRCEDALHQIGLPLSVSDALLSAYMSRAQMPDEVPPAPASYDEACQLLGLPRHASLASLKRAYRRQVSRCHPDKLSGQQLSARELALARERLLRYQQAWELIRRRHRAG